MKKEQTAKKMARMFLGALDAAEAEKCIGELEALSGALGQSVELRGFFMHPGFTEDERSKVFEALGSRFSLSGHTVKFLSYMGQRGTLGLVTESAGYARQLFREKNNRARATVTTASELQAAQRERLLSSISALTGKTIEIDYRTDPSVIGGVLVQVGSTMLDTTVRGQLRLMKDELIKE